MGEIRFDEDELLCEAREATGLGDFGSEEFRPGLRALIGIVEKNPFTEEGRAQHRGRLVTLLSTRLRCQEAFRRHPEILARRIERPIFLTGLPRSGTSALLNLLAADPAARPLLLWEANFPDPKWDLAPGKVDPRHEAMRAISEQLRRDDPAFTRAHYADADTPEECVLLQAVGLDGAQLGYELLLDPYASWFVGHDLRPLYRYYADLLRLLDWQRPGPRWLLKSPAHLWALDALAETFPNCCIVWNHRDPAACIASVSSLLHMLIRDRVEITPLELGPRILAHYGASMDRALAARARLDPARVLDVSYDALVADPPGAARRVYERFGLPLERRTLAALEAHSASHPKDEHGRHEYELEAFGLTREQVRERFADYLERFDL